MTCSPAAALIAAATSEAVYGESRSFGRTLRNN
jgi:hypothetical protein